MGLNKFKTEYYKGKVFDTTIINLDEDMFAIKTTNVSTNKIVTEFILLLHKETGIKIYMNDAISPWRFNGIYIQ